MKFNDIVQACVQLRLNFERDEAKFFLGLVEVEEKWMGVLRENGCPTFDFFIRSYEFCRVERYTAFKAGLQRLEDRKEAERIGARAVMALTKVADPRNIPSYLTACNAWSEKHRGLAPSSETAERILRQVDPRPEIPSAVKELSEVARLRLEVTKLKSRIKELELENAKLRAKVPKKKRSKAA